jgi:hypothetical protein
LEGRPPSCSKTPRQKSSSAVRFIRSELPRDLIQSLGWRTGRGVILRANRRHAGELIAGGG